MDTLSPMSRVFDEPFIYVTGFNLLEFKGSDKLSQFNAKIDDMVGSENWVLGWYSQTVSFKHEKDLALFLLKFK
ncbi:hypothetical protein KAT92_05820 [Candidatus Babeliales bacterium]|nr:hypothetical protein [Candidatus Babeliales bacterium]